MAYRVLCCMILLAGYGLTHAGRIVHTEMAELHLEDTANATAIVAIEGDTLTKLLTSATGIITSMVSAFSESPPDYEYAFDSLNTQGWRMVKSIVPAESQKDKKFKNAGKAWKEAFNDAAELTEDIMNGASNGDVSLLCDAILQTVSKALKTASAALPDDSKKLGAFDDLFRGVGGSMIDFGKAMGWMDTSSLIQIEGKTKENNKVSQMLATGVGIMTSMISAFSEEPPDYEHAIDTLNIQGWKMVKIMVPKEDHRSPTMKKSKKAWDRVMGQANDILEDTIEAHKSGYMGKIMEALLQIIDTALGTAADILTAEKALLEALAEFIKGFGRSILEFSVAMGWIAEY